ncbi:MAG: hypothetical protein A2521_10330 [Deltaproteobacteria bacterium RIFOXYD12_FULL_57_12]|nr:MAG: hypothetical protein A2521_10330 [Deltaproteobacteria bacterium RIFOXYD12_FULL_57_12]
MSGVAVSFNHTIMIKKTTVSSQYAIALVSQICVLLKPGLIQTNQIVPQYFSDQTCGFANRNCFSLTKKHAVAFFLDQYTTPWY